MGGSVDSNSINPPRNSGVEMDDFAGDLLPQSSAVVNCSHASGSSRRKSPIRPMQVLRSEPVFYHSENGDQTWLVVVLSLVFTRLYLLIKIFDFSGEGMGTELMQQKQLIHSLPHPTENESVNSVASGLVDLCAAAGLDSSTPNLRLAATDCSENVDHLSQSIPPCTSQYSLLSSNLVSFQPDGKY